MKTGEVVGAKNLNQKKLLYEGITVLIAILGLFFILARNAGGPVNSDNLFYMDAGLNGMKSVHTLFYYFHIFLQRLFMELAPTPLGGARLFWGFLIASTSALIYFNIRIFPFRNSRINAILGVCLFLSLSFISAYSGKTENDLTAMFIVSLIIAVYMLSANNGFKNSFLIAVLGFLVFLASRSKETAMMVSFLIIGFGFSEKDGFQVRAFLRRMPAFLIGFGCGIVFFLILNSLILNDIFWGFRPAEIISYFTAVESHARWGDISRNFLNDVILSSMLFPFLLFLYCRDSSPGRICAAQV